jgi:predicted transglutaminase-like cysteine proteinase
LAPTGLHLLVVYDENREGHAVLGVDVFDRGTWHTLVLDNKNSEIITLEAMEQKYSGFLTSFVTRTHNGQLRVQFFKYASRGKR